jgi:prepilin-type N-terminal cleavage/methylation domain-containing protein
MTRRSLRRGFTLAEILIAMVMIGFMGAVFTRVLMVQSRYYDQQNAKRNARSVSRNAMNVILSDLRMVQDSLGVDSLSTDGKLIRVRVPYAFGLVCSSTAAAMTVSMLPVDSAVVGMAQYNGYAWRNPANGLYTYVPTAVAPSAGVALTCTGNLAGQARIATLNVNGRSGSVLLLTPGDAAAQPTNGVFFWQRIT